MNDYLEIRELYHHGIKGQKWGIRRYQNEDGSLTAEGKQRYQINDYDGSMSKAGRKLYKKDQNLVKKANASTLKTATIGGLKGSAIVSAGVTATAIAIGIIGTKMMKNDMNSLERDGRIAENSLKALSILGKSYHLANAAGVAAGASIAVSKKKKAEEKLAKINNK